MHLSRVFTFAVLAVSLIMIASVALAGGEGADTPATDEKAPAAEMETEASDEQPCADHPLAESLLSCLTLAMHDKIAGFDQHEYQLQQK